MGWRVNDVLTESNATALVEDNHQMVGELNALAIASPEQIPQLPHASSGS